MDHSSWVFEHQKSSPGHQQTNGQAESAVKMAKNILKKAKESKTGPYLAILTVMFKSSAKTAGKAYQNVTARNCRATQATISQHRWSQDVYQNVPAKTSALLLWQESERPACFRRRCAHESIHAEWQNMGKGNSVKETWWACLPR